MELQDTILFLNRLLANYFVMYIKLHRYIWHMNGKEIIFLQETFKEISLDCKSDIDCIAEHILSISGKPYATMVKFIKEASIKEATADDEIDEIMIQLINDFTSMIAEIETIGMELTIEQEDFFTQHLLVQQIKNLYHYRRKCQKYYQ